jgi:hypothetical protein
MGVICFPMTDDLEADERKLAETRALLIAAGVDPDLEIAYCYDGESRDEKDQLVFVALFDKPTRQSERLAIALEIMRFGSYFDSALNLDLRVITPQEMGQAMPTGHRGHPRMSGGEHS